MRLLLPRHVFQGKHWVHTLARTLAKRHVLTSVIFAHEVVVVATPEGMSSATFGHDAHLFAVEVLVASLVGRGCATSRIEVVMVVVVVFVSATAVVIIVAALLVSSEAVVAVVALLRVEATPTTVVVATAVIVTSVMVRVEATVAATAFSFHHFITTSIEMTVLAAFPARSLTVFSFLVAVNY